MPDLFKCPRWREDKEIAKRTTPYVAICGEHTAWPSRGVRKMADITDGAADTLLILQSEPSRLPWMAPFDPYIAAIDAPHPDGASNALADSILQYADGLAPIGILCDGSVVRGEHLTADTLRAFCTVDGGEDVAE